MCYFDAKLIHKRIKSKLCCVKITHYFKIICKSLNISRIFFVIFLETEKIFYRGIFVRIVI